MEKFPQVSKQIVAMGFRNIFHLRYCIDLLRWGLMIMGAISVVQLLNQPHGNVQVELLPQPDFMAMAKSNPTTPPSPPADLKEDNLNLDGFLLRRAKDIPQTAEDDHKEASHARQRPLKIPSAKQSGTDADGRKEISPKAKLVKNAKTSDGSTGVYNSTRVIVTAYYRGGSSMLGRVMKYYPDSFYLFEPFTAPFREYKRKHHYGNMHRDIFVNPDTGKYMPLQKKFSKWVVETALNILHCNVEDLPENMLTYSQMRTTHAWLQTCLTEESTDKAKQACMKRLREECLNAPIRAFKTIRLPMEIIEKILNVDSGIKIIYSTRDPRGIINSRKNLEKFDDDQFPSRLVDLRSHIEHDLEFYFRNKLVRKNTYVLNYDKLTDDTVGETRSIYKWMGVPITDKTLKKISKMDRVKGGEKPEPKWKTGLTRDQIDQVNTQCKWIMLRLGYDKFEGM